MITTETTMTQSTPKECVLENLSSLTIEELKEVIGLSRQHIKAKTMMMASLSSCKGNSPKRQSSQPAMRSSLSTNSSDSTVVGKRSTTRFWDRSLSLDWNDHGIPKIQYPTTRRQRAQTASPPADGIDWDVFGMMSGCAREIDWQVFDLLSPVAAPAVPDFGVDWAVLGMLSPQGKMQLEPRFMDEDDFVEPLLVDWSCNRLPTSGPARRQPGPRGAANASRSRRLAGLRRGQQESPDKDTAPTEQGQAASPTAAAVAAKLRRPMALPVQRLRNPALRMAPNHRVMRSIQQPCGGGR